MPMRTPWTFAACACIVLFASECSPFSTYPCRHTKRRNKTMVSASKSDCQHRRDVLKRITFAAGTVSLFELSNTKPAVAANNKSDREPTVYKTGKAPIVPNQKEKDKNDTSGTRYEFFNVLTTPSFYVFFLYTNLS